MDLAEIKSSLSLKERFNRDVFWNIASLAVLGVSGVIINIVIAAYAGSAALGVFNQVYAIYIMLSQITVGGLHYSALKSISHNQDDRRRCADIACSAIVLSALLAAIVCAAAYLLRNWTGHILDSPSVVVGLKLAIPGLLFFSLNKVLLNVLNGMRAMRAYAVFQSLRFILILLTVLIVLLGNWPSEYLAFSLTASEVVLFVLLAGYIHAAVFPLLPSAGARGWFREHVSYGLRGFFSGFLSEMNTRVDVLMLGYFCGDATVGIYSFAAILAEGICQLPIVIRRNVDPIIGRCFAENDKAKMHWAAQKIKRATYLIMGTISVAAVAVYPLILKFSVQDRAFEASWGIFAVLMTGIAINSGYRPFLGILLQGGRPGTNTVLIGAVVGGNAVMNAILIPPFGMHGAATATALAYVLEAVMLVLLARRLFGVRL